ncbi:hypothetical protein CEXT_191741 [Caerostris extrusa]|uniref:Uncharacterized protein n=1 Tax=Caerostris extrusa TaxID=172846 RepID=A0AAV4NFB1_CAEEX|nr:hypothetical protein CEXT_191741 [Caerostris extrusa]
MSRSLTSWRMMHGQSPVANLRTDNGETSPSPHEKPETFVWLGFNLANLLEEKENVMDLRSKRIPCLLKIPHTQALLRTKIFPSSEHRYVQLRLNYVTYKIMDEHDVCQQ